RPAGAGRRRLFDGIRYADVLPRFAGRTDRRRQQRDPAPRARQADGTVNDWSPVMETSTSTPAARSAVQEGRFRTIRSARAFEEIAEQIRAELSAGRLQVGSKLPPERALAEQFGVSRNTLREALRSLEHAGLIRLQKGATG